VLVFSASRDKDIPPMLELLLPQFDAISLTRYLENPRAVPPTELNQLAEQLTAQLPADRRPHIAAYDNPVEADPPVTTIAPVAGPGRIFPSR
jgi:folylpolyglutamate synthase/dihydropteroate synthase